MKSRWLGNRRSLQAATCCGSLLEHLTITEQKWIQFRWHVWMNHMLTQQRMRVGWVEGSAAQQLQGKKKHVTSLYCQGRSALHTNLHPPNASFSLPCCSSTCGWISNCAINMHWEPYSPALLANCFLRKAQRQGLTLAGGSTSRLFPQTCTLHTFEQKSMVPSSRCLSQLNVELGFLRWGQMCLCYPVRLLVPRHGELANHKASLS